MLKPLAEFLSFAPPLMGEEEIGEVSDTIRSGWLTTGPKTERFEKAMAAFVGANAALAVNSCTSALHLGLKVLGVEEGHGVVTTPLTFASTAHVIMHQKARPFFVDIDPKTGNLDPQKVQDFFERQCARDHSGRTVHRPTGLKIKAIMPVHYGGHPVDLASFWALAQEYNLDILEDAAHAVGAEYNGRPIGHPATKPAGAAHLKGLAAFSFYATKNMATGEGGLLTADDEELLARARVLSIYGISDARKIWGRYAPKGTWVYDVAELGYKYNMMDLQAALGLHQLAKLPEFIAARARRAEIYNQLFAEISDLVATPTVEPWATKPAWHLYPLRLRSENLSLGRDEVIEKMRALNIGSSVLFIPLHYHSYYQQALELGPGAYPAAENFFQNLINLPLAPAHSEDKIAAAAALIRDLLKSLKK